MGKNPNGFVATAEIGSLLIKSKAGLRKELLKELMITLQHIWNSSSSSWSWLVLISSLVEHNGKNSFFSPEIVFKLVLQLCRDLRYLQLWRDRKNKSITVIFTISMFYTHQCWGAGWWQRNPWQEGGPDLPGTPVHTEWHKNVTGDRKMLKSLVGWCSKVAK